MEYTNVELQSALGRAMKKRWNMRKISRATNVSYGRITGLRTRASLADDEGRDNLIAWLVSHGFLEMRQPMMPIPEPGSLPEDEASTRQLMVAQLWTFALKFGSPKLPLQQVNDEFLAFCRLHVDAFTPKKAR